MFLRIIKSVVLLGIGAGIGYFASGYNGGGETFSEFRANDSSFSFINPLLECNIGEKYLSQGQVKPSRESLVEAIEERKGKGDVDFVSLYYRDLNNGPWLGINEREKFFPASLMKLPLMISILKEAESNPALLDQEVGPIKTYSDVIVSENFPPKDPIEPGKKYKVRDLIDHMIKYSDNKAAFALFEERPDSINKLLKDLYMETPQQGEDYLVNVRDYSSFFRVLFNSSYLSRTDSEKALKLLSETDFDVGLSKYLPGDIKVSNKFGERERMDNNIVQIHDCGIVYYPKHPYLICIMARGKDPSKITDTIASLSKIVYEEIDSIAKTLKKD